MAKSTVQVWENFLKRYYWENILALANNYPAKRSLEIDFSNLERFDMEVASELLDAPDSVLVNAKEALQNVELPIELETWNPHIRLTNLPEKIQIRELRSVHIDRLMSITGLVRKVTEVRPNLLEGAFECQRCMHITYLKQSGGKYTEPFACDNEICSRKGPFKLIRRESILVDAQKLRLQESPDDLRGGEQPQTIDVHFDDDLTGTVSPGDRVIITGILRSIQRITQHGKTTSFDLVLDGMSVEIEDKGFEDIEISKDEIKAILALGSDQEIYNKVIRSISPSIWGYEEVKEAIALQLFSGVPKTLPEGTQLRGDIHILLVGDPGVAKSQLLRYVVRLAPRGIYTSGKSSTSAGLTATAIKDDFGEGKWTLEAGALVLADMGMACVDELDKMSNDDRNSIHEALEQQTISVAKAGIMATLKSRCALLGAANPKFGRFDKYEPIGKQINMAAPLLSRFDLIFTLTDEPSQDKDRAIAQHIFKAHRAGALIVKKNNIVNSGITDEEITSAVDVVKPAIDPDLLRKYIAYTKRTVFPIFDEEASSKLIDFYLDLRKSGELPNSPVPATARQLEALIRLAEASARIRLSQNVTLEDAERVIRIVMASIRQVMTDPETGEIDADLVNTGIGKSQRHRIKVLMGIIKELQKEHNSASIEDILSEADAAGIDKKDITHLLTKLKSAQEIVEQADGQFTIL